MLAFTVPISKSGFKTKWFAIQNAYLKMYCSSCTHTHHDVTTFVVDGLIQNVTSLKSQIKKMNFTKKYSWTTS